MKTKLSKEFLYKKQKDDLNRQVRLMILWALLLITWVSMIITLLYFGLSDDTVAELNSFDAFYICFAPLFIIALGIFTVISLCGLIGELYEIFGICFLIRQIKNNNYTIHTIGQWYEVCCDEKWLGIYQMTEYEL